MQHRIPTNMSRIHKTRIGTAPLCRKCADQRAIGITTRKPVPTMASVASESRCVATALTVIVVKFERETTPGGIGGWPKERMGARIKAWMAAEPPNVRHE